MTCKPSEGRNCARTGVRAYPRAPTRGDRVGAAATDSPPRVRLRLGRLAGAGLLLLASCSDPLLPDPARHYVDVATGGAHSCAVAESGDAYCWGRGSDGQLGHSQRSGSTTPVLVWGELSYVAVTVGDTHSCGLTTDGRAFCWGWNAFYQLGTGRIIAEAVPNRVDTTLLFTQLSAGAYHTCGVALDARVYCWGYSRWGQTGNGGTQATIEPTPVAADLRAVAVSSGGFHSCALTAESEVYCWGANDAGQLGTGSAALFSTIPTRVPAPAPWSVVSAGRSHSCAISGTGEAFCWGSNAHGELGDGVPFRPDVAGPATPTPVRFLEAASSISAGHELTCATGSTGLGWCWGRNERGQLGIGSVTGSPFPTPVFLFPVHLHSSDLLRFSKIAAGGAAHVCGLADGSVYCWGNGTSGELGGPEPVVTQPRRVRP